MKMVSLHRQDQRKSVAASLAEDQPNPEKSEDLSDSVMDKTGELTLLLASGMGDNVKH
jgi:hypothetical protein